MMIRWWGLLPSSVCKWFCRVVLLTLNHTLVNMALCQCVVLLVCLFWCTFVWIHLQLFAGLSSDCILSCRQKTAEWSSDDETKELNAVAPALPPTEHVQTQGPAPAPCPSYKKSLRLSSEQIVRQVITEKISQRQFAVYLKMSNEAQWKKLN